jgi:hypothetical protein
VREEQITGYARQRVAGGFEISIDREASLSPDLKRIITHRCNAIRLSATIGTNVAVFEMTPDQARQLAEELVSAADQWSDPMDVEDGA